MVLISKDREIPWRFVSLPEGDVGALFKILAVSESLKTVGKSSFRRVSVEKSCEFPWWIVKPGQRRKSWTACQKI